MLRRMKEVKTARGGWSCIPSLPERGIHDKDVDAMMLS